MPAQMVEVEVLTLFLDKVHNTPILILKERNGNRILPIWIGFFEAESIMMALNGVVLPRPITHDLCSDTISILGGKLLSVHIYNLKNATFYARLIIKQDDKMLNVDCRPSDSVAIALRQAAPILVSEKVMAEASITDTKNLSSSDLEELLKDLPDEAFGKYKM